MKIIEATLYSGARFSEWIRVPPVSRNVYSESTDYPVIDELVKLFDPRILDGQLFLGRVRQVGPMGSLLVELYPDSEPPFKTLVVDGEGWSYQRVSKAAGGSWLSHNSVNRRWIELEGKVRIVIFGHDESAL